MLSNIVIIVLALALPASAFLCFKVGYQTGRAVRENAELPEIKPRARNKPEPIDPEQERLIKILNNIDNYNGTGEGQIKI